MDKKYIKELALQSLLLDIRTVQPDDIVTDELNEAELKYFYTVYDKAKNSIVNKLEKRVNNDN